MKSQTASQHGTSTWRRARQPLRTWRQKRAPAKVVASYTVDGKTLNAKTVRKGIVINKLSNGKARKVVK